MISRLTNKALTSRYPAVSINFRRAILAETCERSLVRHSISRSARIATTIVQLRQFTAKDKKPEDDNGSKIPKGFEQFFDKDHQSSAYNASRKQPGKDDPKKQGTPQPPPSSLSTWLSILLFTSLFWVLTIPSDTGKETTWQDFRTLLLGRLTYLHPTCPKKLPFAC